MGITSSSGGSSQEEFLVRCDSCFEADAENHDVIVLCDLCNLAVHQTCYARTLAGEIPEGDWFCERCLHLMKNNLPADAIKCFLCNDLTGVVIQLDQSGKSDH